MTALILAQKRITAVIPVLDFSVFKERFASANHRGAISASLISLTAVAVIIYLAALFSFFSLGLKVQGYVRAEDDLVRTLQARELALQEKIGLLANREGVVLESMERVSAIKYLIIKGLAVNNKQ
jgi:hypothetical protein